MLISAAITPDGSPGRIMAALLARRAFTPVLSPAILQEVSKAIRSRKLRRYVQDATEAMSFVADAVALADVVPDTGKVRGACRDPGDDAVLSAALEGRATIIVTGDADLLSIGDYDGVAIMSPRAFLHLIES